MTDEKLLKIVDDLREHLLAVGKYLGDSQDKIWIWCHGNGNIEIETDDDYKYLIKPSGEESITKPIKR